MHEYFDLITNPFKYKCKTSQVFMHPFKKNYGECKMQFMNSDLITFKVNDSTHVQMLIIQEIQKKSLTHSSINLKH
jgi:hypothetical protein